MSEWRLGFISREDFKEHVAKTIGKYGKKLEDYGLAELNSNIIDPIKMLFDKNVYGATWDEIIKNEIFRQRDKASTNDIGYFHQNIFSYFEGCEVPKEGWDVIYRNAGGIELPDGRTVHTVYVEMKNKHNTMNSSASANTYIKMQNQLLNDDDCACFLVEAIAKKSQNEKWTVTVNKQKVSHSLIRRVSMDRFYEIVTGSPTAFHDVCMALPEVISEAVAQNGFVETPRDTAFEELCRVAAAFGGSGEESAMAMSMYLLGFGSYEGFSDERAALRAVSGISDAEKKSLLKLLYEYAKAGSYTE